MVSVDRRPNGNTEYMHSYQQPSRTETDGRPRELARITKSKRISKLIFQIDLLTFRDLLWLRLPHNALCDVRRDNMAAKIGWKICNTQFLWTRYSVYIDGNNVNMIKSTYQAHPTHTYTIDPNWTQMSRIEWQKRILLTSKCNDWWTEASRRLVQADRMSDWKSL